MTDTTIRPIVEAFYQASAQRDAERVASFLSDDVDWLVQGPVDVFPFLGQRRGRTAVLEGFGEIARRLHVTNYKVEALLVDGDRAAALIRISAVLCGSDKVISVRTSQFSRFRDGKLVEMRGLLDSFDMVEQTIGRALDVAPQPAEQAPAA